MVVNVLAIMQSLHDDYGKLQISIKSWEICLFASLSSQITADITH